MIISHDKNWLTKVSDDNGDVIITHNVDNTAIAEQAKFIRDNTDRGFTADRQMQLVGYVPFEIFFSPEHQFHKRPLEELFKFMETEEMAPYRVSRKNTGHSGKVIIK